MVNKLRKLLIRCQRCKRATGDVELYQEYVDLKETKTYFFCIGCWDSVEDTNCSYFNLNNIRYSLEEIVNE